MALLDKHLKKVTRLDEASRVTSRALAAPGLAFLFLLAVGIFVLAFVPSGPLGLYVIVGGLIGGYMALYVGANDVANNVGPAVGGRALTMTGALILAAFFEAAGALLAGGDVVATISKEIIRPPATMEALDFILVMMAGFLSAAMWIHLATHLGAPVSTTHSVVGGVLGSGIAASGAEIVAWPTMGAIAASWIVSPIMGGVTAAALFRLIQVTILNHAAPQEAARQRLPLLIGAMAGIFGMYLATKGFSRVWSPTWPTVAGIGVAAFFGGWFVTIPWVARRARQLGAERKQVTGLFVLPLVVAAALLCFAHGANDVANAVGPLAAIVAAARSGMASPDTVAMPIWILVIGALGISTGLALFGPRVIRTVGEKITKMNPSRAYCVALSAAATVLVASALGLPVSTTHITVGGVFGIGLLRERITNRGIPNPAIRPRTRFLKVSELNATPEEAVRRMQKRERRRLVRRQYALTIGAAWVITVPASAVLAALLYLAMRAISGV